MKRIATLMIVLPLLILGQGPTKKARNFAFQGEIGPVLIPTTATDVCTASTDGTCSTTRTVWVTKLSLTDESGNGDTCYIVDKQATPRSLTGVAAHPVSVPPSSQGVAVMVFEGGRKMVNGITWSCTGGTVTAYMVYEY